MRELAHYIYTGFALSVVIDGNRQTLHIKAQNSDNELGASFVSKRLSTPIEKLSMSSKDVQALLRLMEDRQIPLLKDIADDIIKTNMIVAIDKIVLQYDDYIENIKEIREQERKEEADSNALEIEEISSEFKQFLEDNEITLFGYIEYLARWFSGGEARNTLIGFLCHFGTFSGVKPLWFMALGKAGEGKSFIEEASLKLVPSKFQENGLKTPAALIRKGQVEGLNYLDRKILTMGDMGDPKDYEDYRRVMHKYKKMTTEGHDEFEAVGDNPDPVTGERQTILMELSGYPSVCFTSVNSENVDDQFLSRGLTVTPEASDKQVADFVMYMQSGSVWRRKSDDIVRNQLPMLHAHLERFGMMDGIDIINPYYYCLEDWFGEDEYFKRALTKYPELVKIVTYLNSDDRELVSNDYCSYYVSTKEDNMVVAQLLNPSSNLSGVAIKVYNQLLRYYSEYDEIELTNYQNDSTNLFEQRTIFSVSSAKEKLRNSREFRGLNYGEIFYNLNEAGLLQNIGKVHRSRNNIYCLTSTEPYGTKDINFDEELIQKYLENVDSIYAIPWENLKEIVDRETSSGHTDNPYGKFKPAPWFF